MRLIFCTVILGCTIGCAGNRELASGPSAETLTAPPRADFATADESPWESKQSARRNSALHSAHHPPAESRSLMPRGAAIEQRELNPQFRTVAHRSTPPQEITSDGILSIDGKRYRLQLVEETFSQPDVMVAGGNHNGSHFVAAFPQPDTQNSANPHVIPVPEPVSPVNVDTFELNLPTALSMVGGQHPAVGLAQWRVQEAYARLDQAEVLWLPSLQAGFSFDRHDGNLQASDGKIVDVNRNAFQYGMGAGAVGAGTTPRPGVVAEFHLADAVFQPKIARKTAWARGHAANGVMNEQLLNVAVAYLELLNAHQDSRIMRESLDRTHELSKLTTDFADTGQGLQADADRVATELTLVESRLVSARERIAVASARLAEALSIGADRTIAPLDPTVVPIDLVPLDMEKATLISTGLRNRPELKESQALVSAAFDQYKRQKYAPFVPSVLLGVSTGGFGGGLGNNLSDVDSRYDVDALMTWEVRNLGFGEKAARREATSRIEQAKFEKIRVMDQVTRQVNEAHVQVLHRAERITVTQRAIETAQNSYQRNLSRIRDGQGLPLEVLQSVQALEDARRAYLNAVMDYNEAQFRLQWALGWPVDAPATS